MTHATKCIALVAVIFLAGCLGAPPEPLQVEKDSTSAWWPYDACGPGSHSFDGFASRILSSASNPWTDGHHGVVIPYHWGGGANWIIFGIDQNHEIWWWMQNATDADLARFKAYPGSRHCFHLSSNPGSAGTDTPPDPNITGPILYCAPDALWDDSAYCTMLPCVPRTCKDEGGKCDISFNDGCGNITYCGCGVNQTCGLVTPNVCTYCKKNTCKPNWCGEFNDGCGGTMECGGIKCFQ